jgi:predicted ATPase with chaperone activity
MKFYWHVHHDTLLEPSDNINERIDYIVNNKPKDEIETRIRLIHEIEGNVPESVAQAWDTYMNKSREYAAVFSEYNTAWYESRFIPERGKINDLMMDTFNFIMEKYDRVKKEFFMAQTLYYDLIQTPEIKALHEKECPDCPWNGKTIFPLKRFATVVTSYF